MKITISAEVEMVEKPIEITFSDESLDNYNFVDLIVNGITHTVSVEDIHLAVMPFLMRRDRAKEV